MENNQYRLFFETKEELLQVLLEADLAVEDETVSAPRFGSDEFTAPNEGRIIPIQVSEKHALHVSPPYYKGGKYSYDDVNEFLTTVEEPVLCSGWHVLLLMEEYSLPDAIKPYIVTENAPCDMSFSS